MPLTFQVVAWYFTVHLNYRRTLVSSCHACFSSRVALEPACIDISARLAAVSVPLLWSQLSLKSATQAVVDMSSDALSDADAYLQASIGEFVEMVHDDKGHLALEEFDKFWLSGQKAPRNSYNYCAIMAQEPVLFIRALTQSVRYWMQEKDLRLAILRHPGRLNRTVDILNQVVINTSALRYLGNDLCQAEFSLNMYYLLYTVVRILYESTIVAVVAKSVSKEQVKLLQGQFRETANFLYSLTVHISAHPHIGEATYKHFCQQSSDQAAMMEKLSELLLLIHPLYFSPHDHGLDLVETRFQALCILLRLDLKCPEPTDTVDQDRSSPSCFPRSAFLEIDDVSLRVRAFEADRKAVVKKAANSKTARFPVKSSQLWKDMATYVKHACFGCSKVNKGIQSFAICAACGVALYCDHKCQAKGSRLLVGELRC